jgi:hypothetical protein
MKLKEATFILAPLMAPTAESCKCDMVHVNMHSVAQCICGFLGLECRLCYRQCNLVKAIPEWRVSCTKSVPPCSGQM